MSLQFKPKQSTENRKVHTVFDDHYLSQIDDIVTKHNSTRAEVVRVLTLAGLEQYHKEENARTN